MRWVRGAFNGAVLVGCGLRAAVLCDLEGIGFWDESVCGRELEEKNSRLVGQILLRAWRGLLDNGSLVSMTASS